MRALIKAVRDLRALPSAIADVAFYCTPDDRPIFVPFGDWGGSYAVETQARFRRMRRQLSLLSVLPCISVFATFSLYFGPIRSELLVPVLLLIAGGFAAYTGIFVAWAWINTRSMVRLDYSDHSVSVQVDPMEAGAASIRQYLASHAEKGDYADLFTVAGALAGFACQMAVRDQARLEGRPSGLVEVALKDGRLLYFGDALNGPLAEDATSVWSTVGEGTPVAAIHDMFEDAVAVLTGEATLSVLTTMVTAVQRHWPAAVAMLDANDVPATSRHLAIARAIRAAQHSRGGLRSDHAARIAMRAAILMSRWDPADVLVPDRVVGPRRDSSI